MTAQPVSTEVPDSDQGGDFAAAVDLLTRARSVLLLAHSQPDADALGSALALALALRSRGADAWVAFDAPSAVPRSLRDLPGLEWVRAVDDVLGADRPACDLVVTVDCGSAERVGRLAALFDIGVPVLVIDHHASNTRFGSVNLVDPVADATAAQVTELLDALAAPIDVDIASLLYAGLATDTGGFRRACAASHRLAARFVEAGVEPAELLRRISDSHPFGWLVRLSGVLGRAELDPTAAGGRGLVFTGVTLEDVAGLQPEESDSVIDILRASEEAQAAAVLKQTGPQRWQVSLRSRGEVLVGDAAVALGGGGHPQAAGYLWRGDYLSGVAALRAALAPTQA